MTDFSELELSDAIKQKLAENEKRKRDTEVGDIKFIGKTAQGRRFLYRVLSITGCFRQNDFTDARAFHMEGRRSIGLELFRDMEKDLVLQLTLENDALESQRLKELEDIKNGK